MTSDIAQANGGLGAQVGVYGIAAFNTSNLVPKNKIIRDLLDDYPIIRKAFGFLPDGVKLSVVAATNGLVEQNYVLTIQVPFDYIPQAAQEPFRNMASAAVSANALVGLGPAAQEAMIKMAQGAASLPPSIGEIFRARFSISLNELIGTALTGTTDGKTFLASMFNNATAGLAFEVPIPVPAIYALTPGIGGSTFGGSIRFIPENYSNANEPNYQVVFQIESGDFLPTVVGSQGLGLFLTITPGSEVRTMVDGKVLFVTYIDGQPYTLPPVMSDLARDILGDGDENSQFIDDPGQTIADFFFNAQGYDVEGVGWRWDDYEGSGPPVIIADGSLDLTEYDIPSSGRITTQGSTIWFDGDDGSGVADITVWDDENGKSIAIIYTDGRVVIETSDGERFSYDNGVMTVTQIGAVGAQSEFTKQFISYVTGVVAGNGGTTPPSFAVGVPYSDNILTLYADDPNAVIVSVVTSTGPAKVIVVDGAVKYIVTNDGSITPIDELMTNNDAGDPVLAGSDPLEYLIDASEVLFEYFRKNEAGESALQTWESQITKPMDGFLDAIEANSDILYARFGGLEDAVLLARAGDGAYRFFANLVGALDDNGNAVGNVDGAVNALITVINPGADLSSIDPESSSGLLLTALFSYNAVNGALQAFSPSGGLGEQLEFANSSVLALGSLAALGVVDAKFANLRF